VGRRLQDRILFEPEQFTVSTTNLILLLLLLFVITFTHDIYSYIPDIKYISKVHSVAAVMYIQTALHVTLFTMHTYTSTSRSSCAVPNMADVCSSLI
jgi:hypothetical protein